jgi:hypothetical protein
MGVGERENGGEGVSLGVARRKYRAVQKSLKIKPLGLGVWEYVGVEKKNARTPILPYSAPFRQSILDQGGRIPFKKFLTHR